MVRHRCEHDRTRGREAGAADPLRARAALPVVAALALFTGAATFRGGHRFHDGPPPAHTGGFGEPTCRACHAGDETPDDPHALVIGGVPQTWRADTVYAITLTIRSPGMEIGGFQLSTRFLGGADHAGQAGVLAPLDDRVMVDGVPATGISYARHSLAAEMAADSSIAWTLRWSSPARGGDIALDVAVNAANGDASPFGDRIFTRRIVVRASDSAATARTSPGQ